MESQKPLVQGFGVRVRGDILFCEALFVKEHVSEQVLAAELHERGRKPRVVRVAWSPIEAGVLHKDASIDLVKEA